MKAKDQFRTGARELRSTDAELAHLRNMMAIVIRHRDSVLPLTYWRTRVTTILATNHLLPAQLHVASALLAQIDAITEGDRSTADIV
jgi:hypothetical protein